jgi:hypothetical protein
MSGEIARWTAASPARRDREIAVVRRETDVALARVAGVAEVGQTAMLGTMGLSMMKREASMLVPEDAPKFDMIATAAVVGMAQQINRLAGQW